MILPPGLSADIDAEVHGGGHIELFGSERDGFGISDQLSHSAGVGTPRSPSRPT